MTIRKFERSSCPQDEFEQQAPRQIEDFVPASAHWYWESNSEHRFVWISDNVETHVGVKPEELYGRSRSDLLEQTVTREEWQEHARTLASHEPFKDFIYKYNCDKFDGNVGWLKINGQPFFSSEGEFLGYRGTGIDITNIKLAEEKAERATDLFERAGEHFSGGLLLVDENDRIAYFSEQMPNLISEYKDLIRVGITFEEWLRRQVNAGLITEAIGREEEWIQERRKTIFNDGEVAEIKRGGRWFRSTVSVFPEGGYLQTLIDITDEKLAKLRIDEERNLLRSLIDNISDMIFAKDLESRYIVANKAVENSMLPLNERHDTVIGKTDADFYAQDRSTEFRNVELQILESGEVTPQVEVFTHHETKKPLWMSTTKAPLRDTTGKTIGIVGSGRDITQQQLLTHELRDSQQRFQDFAETAADWFWESDSVLCIDFLSEKFSELTGSSQDTFLGKSLFEFAKQQLIDNADLNDFQKKLMAHSAFSNIQLQFHNSCDEVLYFEFSGKPCIDENGCFSGYRGVGRNVTEARELEDKLTYRAMHDALTDLPNRQNFEKCLTQELSDIKGTERLSVAGFVDLDQFKLVNDTVGHAAGDQLLCQVTRLLKAIIDDQHMLARLGGDEFGLLFTDTTIASATEVGNRIINALGEYRFSWHDKLFDVGASIGLVALDADSQDPAEVMSQADLACYAAKEGGRNRVHVFTECDEDLINRQNEMRAASGIISALENDSFQLYMQPITKVGSVEQDIHHYEILLRMIGPDGKVIPAGAFIPAAERYGLMNQIDRWVIQRALADFKHIFGHQKDPGLTINLSGASMSDTELFDYLKHHIEINEIESSKVCIELTETAVVNSIDIAQRFMSQIKELGCKMALDDFGSGLSSFSYLKYFEVDYLKIDGSFVKDIVSDSADKAVVTAINSIGHTMGMQTIAEFVIDDAVLAVLDELGIDYAQGYGIGKPVPFSAESVNSGKGNNQKKVA